MTETQLRRVGYRGTKESEARRRRLKGLVQKDLRDRETELRELMDRLREASVAVYEVPAEEAEERLHAAQRIDELVQETARSIRLSKAALRFSPRSVAAPSKHFPLATLRTSLAASRARRGLRRRLVSPPRHPGWMKVEVIGPGTRSPAASGARRSRRPSRTGAPPTTASRRPRVAPLTHLAAMLDEDRSSGLHSRGLPSRSARGSPSARRSGGSGRGSVSAGERPPHDRPPGALRLNPDLGGIALGRATGLPYRTPAGSGPVSLLVGRIGRRAAYSRSPTASRASSLCRYSRTSMTIPSRSPCDMRFADLHGRAAVAASAPEADAHDDSVFDDEQFLDLGLDVRDCLASFGDQPAVSVVPAIRAGDRFVRGGPPLDAGVKGSERRLHVAAIEGRIASAHHLHVLLRHRPPSIRRF